MNEQKTKQPKYMVSIYEAVADPATLKFTFVPRGLQQARLPDEPPREVPQYILSLKQEGGAVAVEWSREPPKAAIKVELEGLALERLAARNAWVARVTGLVAAVESWARELDWVTKRIEKKQDDPRVGSPKVPALVMQQDAVRVLLDPISSSAPGGEGLVDLYLMPGYDDIANLYHREGGWHVHYVFPDASAAARIKAGTAKPLSKETLTLVLDAMKKNGE